MDSVINAAGRALAAGSPLQALDLVALRDDAPGLALRGIAKAQLGELDRARTLLRRAARRFGAAEPVAKARCVAAESEIALALRELSASCAPLDAAILVLDEADDRINAVHARLVRLRRLLVLGRCQEAAVERTALDLTAMPPMLTAVAELVAAELAIRRVDATAADAALVSAGEAARLAG
ncbi:MAG: helix-turn-helix domain-containing protein, partial [Nannocystaceae bacterium]|nr:helix-turn-helix domain-containing protein [Nannocystaceae bacterium]